MKLFDLLKSLNSGAAADPDAMAIAPQVASPDHQRDELLGELSHILALLDTDPELENPTKTQPATVVSRPITEQADVVKSEAEQQALLNLAEIFEEDLEATVEAEEHSPLLFMPTETIPANPIDPLRPPPQNRQQLVQALLDELLPALEKALDERLLQLDAGTLQQLQLAVAKNLTHRHDRND